MGKSLGLWKKKCHVSFISGVSFFACFNELPIFLLGPQFTQSFNSFSVNVKLELMSYVRFVFHNIDFYIK